MSQLFEVKVESALERKYHDKLSEVFDANGAANDSLLAKNLYKPALIEINQVLTEKSAFEKLSNDEKLDFLDTLVENAKSYSELESKEIIEDVLKPILKDAELASAALFKSLIFAKGNLEFLKLALELGIDFSKPVLLEGKLSPMNNSVPACFYPIHLAAGSQHENYIDRLKFMEANGADIGVVDERGFSTVTYLLISLDEESEPIKDLVVYASNRFAKALDYLLFEKGITYSAIDLLLLKSLPSNIEVSKYAKELFSASLSEVIHLPKNRNDDLLPELVKFKAIDFIYASHYFAAQGNVLELKKTLEHDKIDTNAKDSLGRTAIFYAANLESAKMLVNAGAEINVVDNNGNCALHTVTDLETISYLIEKGSIIDIVNGEGQSWYYNKDISTLVEKGLIKDWQLIPDLVNKVLQKGNLLQVNKLINMGGKINDQLKKDLVESIKIGTLASIEANKFQALIATCKKKGVSLPSFLDKYAADPKDYNSQAEMGMILNDQFLNEMVDKYIETFLPEDSRFCYSNSIQYVKKFNQIVTQIETDFAKEVLVINALSTMPVEQEFFVYRGVKIPDVNKFIEHNKLFGHKSLIKDKPQNFVFHAAEDWNNTPNKEYSWEFLSVYMSYSKKLAESFAKNEFSTSTLTTGNGLLLTIKITPEIQLTCGNMLDGFEVVSLSTIPSKFIKSFTIVDTGEVIFNPHYIESDLDSKPELTEEQMLENYNLSGCEDYVNSKKKEFHDYKGFEEIFKPEFLVAHRAEEYAKEVCAA
jgi:ankyrin repeat protein